jgi:4-hydroxy-3-methylbut-2-enyl diphosphate reductase
MYSAIGAGCLSVASTLMQKAGINILGIVIASFYVFAMHTVNRLQDRNLGRVKGSFREEGYTKYKKVYMLAAIASLALSLAMSFIVGFASFALLLFISVLGMGYNIMIFPEKWHLKRLVDIPGSKNIFIAAAWASVIVLVPVISTGLKVTTEMTAAFIFVLSLVFMKSVLSDMIDIQSDRIVGRETMPVVMGKDNASRLLRGVSVFTGIFLVVSFIAGYSSSIGMALLVPVFYIWICIKLCDKRLQLSGIVLEGLLGTSYIIAGLSSCLWLIIGRYVVA